MQNTLLSFLTDYLDDIQIPYKITNDKKITLSDLDMGLRKSIIKDPPKNISNAIRELKADRLYNVIDSYRCCYSFFMLGDKDNSLIFIGPYTYSIFSEREIAELMQSFSMPEELNSQIQEYYRAIPYVQQKKYFHKFLLRIHKNISGCEEQYETDIDLASIEELSDFKRQHIYEVPTDPTLSMKLLEKTYTNEDELLNAIAHGNTTKALACYESIDTLNFKSRSSDILKHTQSLAITCNTLLRRAAYEAGVHPFYIDNVSNNFARMINDCSSVQEVQTSYAYMIKSYCRLVNKYNLSSYSQTVRHILVTVDASLDGDLTLKRFADELFLSTSYLSTLFKKEIGLTLTDYVNKSRITAAQKLLRSTRLSTQQIAIDCGIPDIHYFTRLFRRQTGMTPKEWRTQSVPEQISEKEEK